ncbi:MAG: ribose 5-phosphate isomerase B [Sorangium cellulosum]|nr:MAG: ribose 5-phosphate isomerase B [Sorangium cellulosum]
MTKLAIASDHGGYALKSALIEAFLQDAIAFEDLGTHDASSCDYPDFAHAMARGLEEGKYDCGVLICGTGIGMSIAANRHNHVRAAVVSDTYSAKMARLHNDANVLCMGERVVGPGLAYDIVRIWLNTTKDPNERHARRVAKINPS